MYSQMDLVLAACATASIRCRLVLSVKGTGLKSNRRGSNRHGNNRYAFTILPALMQLVHTRIRFAPPPTAALTGRRFTFQRRLDTLCACEILFPNCGPLPQILQTCAMTNSV